MVATRHHPEQNRETKDENRASLLISAKADVLTDVRDFETTRAIYLDGKDDRRGLRR